MVGVLAGTPRFVEFKTDSEPMLRRLREPVSRALDGHAGVYAVEVAVVGRVGEVLVSVTGSKGRLPLLFGHEELEPGYVCRVVRDAVDRYAP
jgi:hypothetical protein